MLYSQKKVGGAGTGADVDEVSGVLGGLGVIWFEGSLIQAYQQEQRGGEGVLLHGGWRKSMCAKYRKVVGTEKAQCLLSLKGEKWWRCC